MNDSALNIQNRAHFAKPDDSKELYAMVETYENVNISVEYQWFCMKPSEQGSFF